MCSIFIQGNLFIQNRLIMEQNITGSWCFQKIDTSEHRGLTGSGCTDHTCYIPFMNGCIDILQDYIGTKGFAEVSEFNDCFHQFCPPLVSICLSSKLLPFCGEFKVPAVGES